MVMKYTLDYFFNRNSGTSLRKLRKLYGDSKIEHNLTLDKCELIIKLKRGLESEEFRRNCGNSKQNPTTEENICCSVFDHLED